MDTPQVLLEHHLKTLRLPTVLREYDKVAQQCAAEGVDFPRYLLRLMELELLDRERRATERRIRQAKFEVVKSLDSFDFLAIPSLNKALVLEMARCEFIERKENFLALGNSGTGKTHTVCTPQPTWPGTYWPGKRGRVPGDSRKMQVRTSGVFRRNVVTKKVARNR
jgi:DNA replication protein DnaC